MIEDSDIEFEKIRLREELGNFIGNLEGLSDAVANNDTSPLKAVSLAMELCFGALHSLRRSRRVILESELTQPERYATIAELAGQLLLNRELSTQLKDQSRETVDLMRSGGATWAEIGKCLGVSKQMAHYHYGRNG